MPIEPTSVSKPQVRDIEKTSATSSSWTSQQGSSTGGKDRPNSSIWEKAISGAQKLFGLESSSTATLEETPNESDSQTTEQEEPSTAVLEHVPGFGSRGFGRFSSGSFSGNVFSFASSRSIEQPDTEGVDLSSRLLDQPSKTSEFQGREKGNQGTTLEASSSDEPVAIDDLEEEGSEKRAVREAKPLASKLSAARSELPIARAETSEPLAPVAPAQTRDAVPVANANVAGASEVPTQAVPLTSPTLRSEAPSSMTADANGKALPNSQQAPQQATGANTPVNSPSTPAANAAPVAASGAKQTLTATPAEAKEASKPLANPVASQENQTAEQAKSSKPAPVATTVAGSENLDAKAQTAKTPEIGPMVAKAKTESMPLDAEGADSKLAIDPAKAKEAMGEALAKAESRSKSAQTGTAVSRPTTAAAETSARVANSDTTSQTRLAEAGSGEVKDASTQVDPLAKKDQPNAGAVSSKSASRAANLADQQSVSRATQQASTESVSNNQESSQAKVGTGAAALTSNVGRESSMAAASRIQNGGTQNRRGPAPAQMGQTNGVSAMGGATATQTAGNTLAGQQANSGGQGGEASQQEVSSRLKQNTTFKGGEKSSSEGGQAFEAKIETAQGNRRSQAASQTKQTSYVSKTVDQMRETVATLSKSIDRLLINKSGAMNLKINFENGGSVNIKISMDANQVNTSMQTDVAGLEGAIKANWAELANDWNQKGLKLNAPQFQAGADSGKGSFENLSEFSPKGERQAEAQGGTGNGSRQGRSTTARSGNTSGTASSASTGTVAGGEVSEQSAPASTASSKELKAYA